jgi:SAM-dependent methyltransferase
MTAVDTAPEVRRFLDLLQTSLSDNSFVKLALGKYQGSEPALQRVLVRRVVIRGEDSLSFVYRHATKDITKNLALADGLAHIREQLPAAFEHAHLLTRTQDIQLAATRKGAWTLRRGKLSNAAPAEAAPAPQHDREKQRFVDVAAPFLTELGVTTADHRIIPAMARKWKQINKFVEVFSHAVERSPLAAAPAVRVLDFGSGKGYLTFAVHEHLRQRGVAPEVTGVELREDLATLCNEAAQRLSLDGLRFAQGDVRTHSAGGVDVMIALHACDTATDHAIHRGVRSGAAVILCSPCCHKQLRPQMHSPEVLQPMLQHGIHFGQQAEMVTDSLRALLLEAEGYEAQVFEFVALEHTSKNKMILAVKRQRPDPAAMAAAREQVQRIKDFYGVREHALEALLAA